jgi:tRNA threonylcarbamoyladenosine biosynthesis protein TsaB
MKILALDTSSPQISVAVADDLRILSKVENFGNTSTELLPCIERALKEAKLDLKQIEAFTIGEGPGSYNGLRCGFATLQGILLVHPRPVVQLNSLPAMMQGVRGTGYGVRGAILNARKNSYFYAKFEINGNHPKFLEDGMVSQIEDIPEIDSDNVYWCSYEIKDFSIAYPDAAVIARLAAEAIHDPKLEKKLGEPRYLRPPV